MYRVIYKYTRAYPYKDYCHYYWVVEKRVWFLWFRVWDVPASYNKEHALIELQHYLANQLETKAKMKDITYVN